MKRLFTLFFCIAFASLIMAKGDELYKGYRGYVDFTFGDAYNFNTAQTISTNNMQLYSMISTTHGYSMKKWFVGGGVAYYHSFRDGESMYPVYAAGRYSFEIMKQNSFIEMRAGIIYDSRWVRQVQTYGALSVGINVCKRLQAGIRLSFFSRPSRFFTANAAVMMSYAFGR